MTVIENSHRGSLDFSATLSKPLFRFASGWTCAAMRTSTTARPAHSPGLAASFRRSGLTHGYSARRANGRRSGCGEEARYQPASLCPLGRQAGVQRARHQRNGPQCRHRPMGTREPPLPYLTLITGFPFNSPWFFHTITYYVIIYFIGVKGQNSRLSVES